MKRWLVFFIILAAFFVGANFLAPSLVETGLYAALSSKFNLHDDDIHVQASPGAKVLLGEMDALTIDGDDVMVSGIRFAHFDCQLYEVHFQPLAALADQAVRVTKAQSGEMTASVTSEELEKFLVKKVKGLTDPVVTFENDAVRVSGKIDLGGVLTADATVRGHFGMQGSKLMFIPGEVEVSGLGVNYRADNLASAEIYDFTDFPLGIQPDSVTMRNGVLTIHGQVRN